MVERESGCNWVRLNNYVMEDGYFKEVSNFNFNNLTWRGYSESTIKKTSGQYSLVVDEVPFICSAISYHGPTYRIEYQEPVGLRYYHQEYFWYGSTHEIKLVAARTQRGDYGIWPRNLSAGFVVSKDLGLWPNPTSGLVNITTDNQILEIRVLDQLGQLIFTSSKNQLDLSKWSSGTYYLNIQTSDKVYHRKVILTSPN
ncbi:MAG: hypothetical protein Salg2KO_02200 [Salibacteraceae bacterium]